MSVCDKGVMFRIKYNGDQNPTKVVPFPQISGYFYIFLSSLLGTALRGWPKHADRR